MGPTWGPPGSCRPQMGPTLARWTLLSGEYCIHHGHGKDTSQILNKQPNNSGFFSTELRDMFCVYFEENWLSSNKTQLHLFGAALFVNWTGSALGYFTKLGHASMSCQSNHNWSRGIYYWQHNHDQSLWKLPALNTLKPIDFGQEIWHVQEECTNWYCSNINTLQVMVPVIKVYLDVI